MSQASAPSCAGCGKGHVLPNISGVVVVRAMFSIPSAIFFETFLSFIGVGMKIPNASIGTLLNGGYKVFNPYALEADLIAEPPMFRVSDTHYAATWLLDPRAPKVEPPQALRGGTKGGGAE